MLKTLAYPKTLIYSSMTVIHEALLRHVMFAQFELVERAKFSATVSATISKISRQTLIVFKHSSYLVTMTQLGGKIVNMGHLRVNSARIIIINTFSSGIVARK